MKREPGWQAGSDAGAKDSTSCSHHLGSSQLSACIAWDEADLRKLATRVTVGMPFIHKLSHKGTC